MRFGDWWWGLPRELRAVYFSFVLCTVCTAAVGVMAMVQGCWCPELGWVCP